MPTQRNLHPDLSDLRRRQLFLAGVASFNKGDFFGSHELWEEVWRSRQPSPKSFYQGLIQVAVGFYHYFDRNRPDVAQRVLAKGRFRLEVYLPECQGLDVENLLEAVTAWELWLAAPCGRAPERPFLVVDRAQ